MIKNAKTTVLKSKVLKTTVLAGLLLGLAGCAGDPPPIMSNPTLTVVEMTELPPPSDAADATNYRIGALDRLVVDVMGFPELANRRIQVDSAGRIAVPIAGSLQAGGMTLTEVTNLIESRLRAAHVRQPIVSVNVEESLSKFVTVDGQVVVPGNYPVVGNMTLMRAIAASRGVSEFARLEDVVVFRTVDGQRMAALYNLAAIRRGIYADPMIYPQDVVIVGNSPARQMFRDFISVSPLIAAPIVTILNNL